MIAFALVLAVAAETDTLRTDSVRTLTVPPWWEAAAAVNAESFASRLALWQWHNVAIRRRTLAATHGVEAFAARRAGIWNAGFALEETRTISERGYVSARAQFAPGARVIAKYDLSLEAYQGFGAGWEALASGRIMMFEDARVPVLALGVGRYVGPWYLRGRVSRARMRGESGFTSVASARRFFGDSPADFVDASLAIGHEVTPLSPTVVDLRRTTDAVIRGQRMLASGLGASVLLSYSANESLPDRRGGALGAFVRWR